MSPILFLENNVFNAAMPRAVHSSNTRVVAAEKTNEINRFEHATTRFETICDAMVLM